MSKIAVVALSGGMDSLVTLAEIRAKGYDIAALHFNYGQRTERRELEAFHAICDHYAIETRLVVDVAYLAAIGASSLTDPSIEVERANLDRTGIPSSYVPFRNANILAIATSWAEALGASAIGIGAVEEDSSGYPDCRREFFSAFERVIELGTRPDTHITILTPVIGYRKAEIVRRGVELGVPFELSWSCYVRSDIACGECDSCALRLRGFQLAGIEDPIPYVVKPRYG
ncbi:MAG: 7-cyano-7-deazaguanine synthase [Candidatus Kapaibacterium sp.]|nr:MAG: 7-cyano-7-deazaguanine synthase [Candidatus Kapabacteria bacterium]